MSERPGRPNLGARHVRNLEGSAESKTRVELVLATLIGERSVNEACEELGIGQTRFWTLRREALQAAVDALEPRSAGRPRKDGGRESEEARRLASELEELKRELALANARAEVTAVITGASGEPPESDDATKKKQSPPASNDGGKKGARSKRSEKRARAHGGRKRGGRRR